MDDPYEVPRVADGYATLFWWAYREGDRPGQGGLGLYGSRQSQSIGARHLHIEQDYIVRIIRRVGGAQFRQSTLRVPHRSRTHLPGARLQAQDLAVRFVVVYDQDVQVG